MSNWTHVNVAMRIDGLDLHPTIENLKEALGPMQGYINGPTRFANSVIRQLDLSINEYKFDNESDLLEFHPINGKIKLPKGSEGSLLYKILPLNATGLTLCNLYIWGDLRNHDSSEDILIFLQDILSKMSMVRSGIAEIDNEYNSSAFNGVYSVKTNDDGTLHWVKH